MGGGGVKPFNLSNEHYYAHFYALIGYKMYEWHVSSNLPELNAKPPQFEKSLVQPLRPPVMVAALWHIRFQMYKSLAGWGCQWKFPLLSWLLINGILQLSGTACLLWENRNFTKVLHYNEIFKSIFFLNLFFFFYKFVFGIKNFNTKQTEHFQTNCVEGVYWVSVPDSDTVPDSQWGDW